MSRTTELNTQWKICYLAKTADPAPSRARFWVVIRQPITDEAQLVKP